MHSADRNEHRMQLAEIASLARELMNAHGLGHWVFEWDNATRRLGSCRFRPFPKITLSRRLVLRASMDVVRNTILHEIAHAKVGPKHGHDATWKQAALAIGCTGERCYTGAEVEHLPGKYQATCGGCGKTYHKFRIVWRRNPEYWCPKCGRAKGGLQFKAVR